MRSIPSIRAMPATQGCLFLGKVSRIRFGKSGSDLGPPADLPHSHGHESNDFARRTSIRPKPCPAPKRACLAFPNPPLTVAQAMVGRPAETEFEPWCHRYRGKQWSLFVMLFIAFCANALCSIYDKLADPFRIPGSSFAKATEDTAGTEMRVADAIALANQARYISS